jgi:hypothetical protein
MPALPIHADPVITKLLDKVPADMRGSMGIDLIPGVSFGVWGWFQAEFLK